MLAVIDETTPFVAAGVCYGVISCVLLGAEDEAKSLVSDVIPAGRRRPFHWHEEGIGAKGRMVESIEKIGVLARAVVVPCGRGRQEAARSIAMVPTIERLVADGCDRLLIERRTPAQDGRDRALILDVLRDLGEPGGLSYDLESKWSPLLWIADAVAGVVADQLKGSALDGLSQRLATSTGLTTEYRPLPPADAPKRRQSRVQS